MKAPKRVTQFTLASGTWPKVCATLLVLSALLVWALPAVSAPIEVELLCDDDLRPYAFATPEGARGAYVDLIAKAASRLKDYRVRFRAIPWKRGLAMMESGEALALFPPYKRAEQRPFMDYDVFLGTDRLVLLALNPGPLAKAQRWPEDYLGRTIEINRGYVFLDKWRAQVKVSEAPSSEAAVRKLIYQRTDAYAHEEKAMMATVLDLRSKGLVPAGIDFVIGPVFATEDTFLSFTTVARSRHPYLDDFKSKLSAALEELRASGDFKRILDSYLRPAIKP